VRILSQSIELSSSIIVPLVGVVQLQNLGIKTVYDLRSDPEMTKYGSTRVPTVEGVEFVRVPVFKDVDYSPENMVKCAFIHVLHVSLTTEPIDVTNYMRLGRMRYAPSWREDIRSPKEVAVIHATLYRDFG
jgi:hypothetical protein